MRVFPFYVFDTDFDEESEEGQSPTERYFNMDQLVTFRVINPEQGLIRATFGDEEWTVICPVEDWMEKTKLQE